MAVKYGIEGKLGVSAALISAPTWVEVTKAKNVTLNMKGNEIDVTSRASTFKMIASKITEISVEFEMLWDPADAAFVILRTAFGSKAPIGVSINDTTLGSPPKFDAVVTAMDREEGLEDAMLAKITLKPTLTANTPVLA